MTNDLKRGDMYVRGEFDGDGELYVDLDRPYLDREDVATLRDHLTAVLGDGPKPTEDVPAVTVEVGREYRLLPDSRLVGSADFTGLARNCATRVVVDEGPDSDGDIRARALDGQDPGYVGYVDPAYLAPLDPSPAAPSVAQAAREVAERANEAGHYATSRYFEHFADKLERRPA